MFEKSAGFSSMVLLLDGSNVVKSMLIRNDNTMMCHCCFPGIPGTRASCGIFAETEDLAVFIPD